MSPPSDMFDEDELDDEDEETFSADEAPSAQSLVQSLTQSANEHKSVLAVRNAQQHKLSERRVRTRPMTPAMAGKFPDVVTIIMTRANGTQVVFVR